MAEIKANMHKQGQARIFKSSFLEALTKTNPLQNIIVYGLIIIGLIYVAIRVKGISFPVFMAVFGSAVLFWTFAEYVLHRYVFHFVNDNPIVQRLHFLMHGSHHEYPKDEQRLLMPPVPGIIMASVLFLVFYCVFWMATISVYIWAFFPGFFLGYLVYSFIHRATHIYKPPSFLKELWAHHSLHHYKYPTKCFGVSNRLWDRVFGTMPPKE